MEAPLLIGSGLAVQWNSPLSRRQRSNCAFQAVARTPNLTRFGNSRTEFLGAGAILGRDLPMGEIETKAWLGGEVPNGYSRFGIRHVCSFKHQGFLNTPGGQVALARLVGYPISFVLENMIRSEANLMPIVS